MSPRGGVLCAALLAALASTEAAAAAPPARVVLRKRACAAPALDEAAFTRLLAGDLAADGVAEVELLDAAAPLPVVPALAVITLEGACESAAVTVVIDDAATDKQLRRAVDLRAVAEPGRAEALSQTTAQLLRASWAELALPHAPLPRLPVPPVVRAATLERLTAVPGAPVHGPEPAPVFLSAGIDGRYLFGPGAGLLGGRLIASIPVLEHLRLRFDAGAAHGSVDDGQGSLDLLAVTGAAGVSFAQAWESAAVEVGPRVEVGWALSRGGAGSSYGASSVLAATTVATTGRLRVGGRGWCSLELELGPVLHGFAARDGSTLRGAMGAARLGIGAAL
jgi:hypothetical protein